MIQPSYTQDIFKKIMNQESEENLLSVLKYAT